MNEGAVAALPSLAPAPAPEWCLSDPPDEAHVALLQRDLKLPHALCAVLAVRGFTTPSDAKSFLRPLLDTLHPPSALPDAEIAVDRLLEAIRTGEQILVHGDYDVDGISGTALLTRWIRRLGGRATPFVPHRLKDGYDFSSAGVEAAEAAGASLVLTVDCGTTALEAVSEARAAGIDVIVTDHHTPGPALPPALAVVNPNRKGSTYPNPGLSGTGVAFKICQMLAEAHEVPKEELYASLDLVALATVADLVPLNGENRTLVRYGLRALRDTSSTGLRALIDKTGLAGKELDAGQIGFVLAPRINAVGRMGAAETALRLLMTEDEAEAEVLAEELEVHNTERREEDRRTLNEALDKLALEYDPERDFGVVLAADGWHPGVIGIVASRVVERIHRPAVLVALSGDRGRGSARSIPGFHLFDAINACSQHLDRFGGHKQAAGMDVGRTSVDAFRDAFNAEAERRLSGQVLRPRIQADIGVTLTDATMKLAHFSQYLGPFGIGNRRPVYMARNVDLASPPRVVKEDHLKLQLVQGKTRLEAIGFGLAGRIPPESLGLGPVDIVFQVNQNEFRGVRSVQARLLDVRRSETAR